MESVSFVPFQMYILKTGLLVSLLIISRKKSFLKFISRWFSISTISRSEYSVNIN